MDQVEIRVPVDDRHVSLARQVVASTARTHGMDEGRVEDLRIAVSEAVTNAVRAHRAHRVAEPIVVRCGPTEQGDFQVVVLDAGPGFAPTPPPVDARPWDEKVNGLGLTLIEGLADRVDFVRGAGMRIHMVFSVDMDRTASVHD